MIREQFVAVVVANARCANIDAGRLTVYVAVDHVADLDNAMRSGVVVEFSNHKHGEFRRAAHAQLRCRTPPGAPAVIPPNLDTVIFRFMVLDDGGVASLKATSGVFGKTRVLSTAVNREITGDISPTATILTPAESYCTAGTSSNGCTASLSATGLASATASSGFVLTGTDVEGNKSGTYYYGIHGRQANPWGNGSSFQCVVPPVRRVGIQMATGAPNTCDGLMVRDLNALWCPTCPKPAKNPGVGTEVQIQLWYRDLFNTSNQTTSPSSALEFTVRP